MNDREVIRCCGLSQIGRRQGRSDVKFLEKFTLGKTIKMCANIRLNNTDFDIPILPHGLRHHITTQQNTWALNSLRLNGHFLGEPGLAGVYWSTGWWRWWWQLDYWSYKSCKAPVKLSPQQTNIQFFTDWVPFLSPKQQCQSTEWKYHIPWTRLPQAHLGVFKQELSAIYNFIY